MAIFRRVERTMEDIERDLSHRKAMKRDAPIILAAANFMDAVDELALLDDAEILAEVHHALKLVQDHIATYMGDVEYEMEEP